MSLIITNYLQITINCNSQLSIIYYLEGALKSAAPYHDWQLKLYIYEWYSMPLKELIICTLKMCLFDKQIILSWRQLRSRYTKTVLPLPHLSIWKSPPPSPLQYQEGENESSPEMHQVCINRTLLNTFIFH